MKFDDLKLLPGYPLQLQVQSATGVSERYNCRYVGALPGKALLLSVPRANGRLLRLRPGQKVVARMMVANGVGVFSCSVESQVSEPYPLLHLDYPDEVGFKGIRQSTRIEVALPVAVVNQSSLEAAELEGKIADISLSGARLELAEVLGEMGDKLKLMASVSVAGIHRQLEVEAVIRSRVERSTQEREQKVPVVYGVEFTEQDENRRLLLAAYVYSRIADDQLPAA